MKKRILGLFTALCVLCLCVMLLPTTARAVDTNGTCGDPEVNGGANVTWKLTQNNTDNDNPTYTLTISGSGATAASLYETWQDSSKSITKVKIDEGVTSIGNFAFWKLYTALESVEIPTSVTSIGDKVFYQCTSLTDVTFGDGSQLTSIGFQAFCGCTSLNRITIPAGVTTIGKSTFKGCTNLTSVTFYDNSRLTTIGEEAFSGCEGLTSVDFGDNSQLTAIGKQAFLGCNSLKSIQLPVSTTIGEEAFSGCEGLTSVTFVDDAQSTAVSASTIGDKAFSGCENLKTVTFDANSKLTEIGDSAFKQTPLESIQIPTSVTSIGMYAFNVCANLQTVTFGDGSQLTTIGKSTFMGCTSLTSVDFGENSQLTTIGKSTFMGCTSLTSVDFGENSQLTTIGEQAFEFCAMTDIKIPTSVTTINGSAFYGCTNLTSVTFGDDSQLTSIDDWVFGECSALTNVVYGGSKSQWDSNVSMGQGNNYYLNDETLTYSMLDITFDANDGTDNGKTAFVVKRDATLGVQFPTAPSRTGYTFGKWVDEKGNEVTKDTIFSADTTVAAQWRKNIGGNDVSGDITVTYGALALTYDGAAKRPTVTVTDGDNTLTEGTDYTLSNTEINVGTYTLTITGSGDYAGTVAKEWSITPKEISVTDATAVSRAYEKDNTTVEISGVTFDGATLTKDTDYTVTGEMADADAGDSKEVSVTVGLNDTAVTKNYTLIGKTTTTTVTINKISYDGNTLAIGSAKYGNAGTVDLSDLIADGGSLTLGTVTDGNSVLNAESGMPKLDGNKLQFAFRDDSALISKTVDVPVNVSGCTNYTDYTITVTLTVLDKQTPTVMVNPISKEYSGSALTDADISGDTNGVEGKWSWKDGNAPKNVADSTKTWTVVFTPTDSDSANYKPVEKEVNVTITAKPLTITGVTAIGRDYAAGNTSVTLDGGTLQGVVGDDDVSFTLGTGTMSDANAGVDKFVTTNIQLSGNAVGNYTLTQPTDVTVTIRKIDPDPASYTVPTGLTATYGQTLADVSLSGHTGWSWKDATTAVGNVGNNLFDAIFTPADTTNYNTVTESVTIAVGKATYGNQTATGGAKYGNAGTVDLSKLIMPGGTAAASVKADTYSVVSDTQIVDLNKLQFAFKDDAGLVGKTAEIEVFVSGCTNYKDYTITVTVTVNAKTVPAVTAPTAIANLTYNGRVQPLITAGSTTGGTLEYSLNGTDWSTSLPTGKDAKDYTIHYRVVGNADYADVDASSLTMTISKAALTITANNKSAVVGAAMPTLTYTVSGLCGSDTLTTEPTLSCTATDTNTAGTYEITVSGGGAGSNYTISKYGKGTLTVSEKQTLTLTLTPGNASLSGGGNVTLTVGGLPTGASCTVTCDTAGITPTGSGSSWSVTLPNTTATYTFTVTFAENSEYNGATATCTVSVTQYTAPVIPDVPTYVPTPTPGTGNNNSQNNKNDTTDTVTNPDGSTTTTETKQDGTVIETTKKEDGSSTSVETKQDGTVTETTTTASGTTATTVTDDKGNVTESKVTVSAEDATSDETVTLPVQDVKPADNSERATEITVEIPQDTNVTVEIPVEDVTPGTVVIIVDEDGNETVVPTTKMTENGVTVTLEGNATIKIVENSKTFSDVTDSDYFEDAVAYASSRGITGGTSEDTFSPNESCTRAQLVTFLWRAVGQPEAKSESSMTDVANDTYYTEAVTWAFENGIVGGYGNGQFGSEDTITREQMAVILYRFAQNTGRDTTQSGMQVQKFNDYDSISDYALTAIQWAVNAGIMQGDNGNLMPTAECTRAQIVTMLYRLLGK